MRKSIGLFLSLSLLSLSLGCPNPNQPAEYEGTWELAYDWYCSGTHGQSIVEIFENGDLLVTDLSDDVENKTQGEAGAGRSSDGAQGPTAAAQNKDSFSGTWEVDAETGLLIMHVGPLDVQYHVTEEDWEGVSGDMYQDDAYVGCFTMVRSDSGT